MRARAQLRLAAFVLLFAGACNRSPKPEPAAEVVSSWNMLAAVDEKIGAQEEVKDVRCYSSVSKLQMLLADAPIDEKAKATRVEEHRRLLDSIFEDAKARSKDVEVIEAPVLKEILDKRFPHKKDEQGTVHFELKQGRPQIEIPLRDIEDYGDTIEPWRLIQSWVLSHVRGGKLELSPQYSAEALQALHDFLLVYDVAVMRFAAVRAHDQKKQGIDSVSMHQAFELEHLL